MDDRVDKSRRAEPARGQPGIGSPSKAWLRALNVWTELTADKGGNLADVLDQQGARLGERPALLSDLETLSYGALAARSRQYTRWALAEGLGRGDVVALLAPNSPDYFAFWVGVSRTGAVVALLNTRLREEALAHLVAVAAPTRMVADPSLWDVARATLKDRECALRRLTPHSGEHPEDLDAAHYSSAPLGLRSGTPFAEQSDTALHIFTSGTTGLPKAARISHGRILSWGGWLAGLMAIGEDDRLYDCLPMYHSVGGVTALSAMLVGGGSVVIAHGFSARLFWDEIRRWDCTIVQYIGELCRYLLAAPQDPSERDHSLRLFCGNGLSGEVWPPFQERFAIPAILEFYAATEGVFSLFNVEGKPGAIGRTPPFLAHRFPAALVRFDPTTGAPARGPDGACIRCEAGEIGEAIGRAPAGAGAGAFEGYTDAQASEGKLLRHVFEPGDVWFRTGDLMRKDPEGYFYFVDRVGETFRWKGENVSTGEVAGILSKCPGVRAVAVYGVGVPHTEGRAGMAAVTPGEDFDLEAFARYATAHLPSYARPVFVRLMDVLPMTDTWKVKQRALAQDGFAADPSRTAWFSHEAGAYVPMDDASVVLIRDGAARL